MPAVEYDGDAKAPQGRSQWIVGGVLVAVVLLVVTRGMVTVLLLALLAVVAGLVIAIGYAAVTAIRGKVPDSGDHDMPTLSPDTDDEAQRREAGHVSPSASR